MAESPPPTSTGLDSSSNLDNISSILDGKFDFNDFLRNAALQLNQVTEGEERDESPPMDEEEELKPPPLPTRNTPKGRKTSAIGSAASGTPGSAQMTTASALACLGAPHPVASQFDPFQPMRPSRAFYE